MSHKVRWSSAFAALMLLFGCATPEVGAAPGPALYVARDADSALYLYGTIHVLKAGAQWSTPAVEAALASSEEIWTELEISPEADAETQRLALRFGMAEPGRPLSSWLSPEERGRLEALAARMGFPAQALEPMRPWFAGLTLSLLPIMRAGYDPQSGVDRAVDAFGDAHGQRMRALETPEQQLGFFAALPDEVQRQMLLEAIDEAENGVTQLDAMSAAWARGDGRALDVALNQDMRRDYPDIYDVLIKRRNQAWMPVLLRELDGAGVDFVAVGAAHVVGRDGLVAQLRARGVRVERVR